MAPVVSCAIAAGTLAIASASAKNVLNNTLLMNHDLQIADGTPGRESANTTWAERIRV
jgi:hypothetical protein